MSRQFYLYLTFLSNYDLTVRFGQPMICAGVDESMHGLRFVTLS